MVINGSFFMQRAFHALGVSIWVDCLYSLPFLCYSHVLLSKITFQWVSLFICVNLFIFFYHKSEYLFELGITVVGGFNFFELFCGVVLGFQWFPHLQYRTLAQQYHGYLKLIIPHSSCQDATEGYSPPICLATIITHDDAGHLTSDHDVIAKNIDVITENFAIQIWVSKTYDMLLNHKII